LLFSSLTCYLD